MKIIGIDPGSSITGWGIIEEKSGVLSLVDCGIVRAKSKDIGDVFAARLAFIFRELHAIIEYYKPDEAAIEQAFTAKNPASALKLGQARGVAVAACASHRIAVYDYEPTLMKKAIVGTGRADKEQVSFMVGKILNIKASMFKLDTTDALGIAICHCTMRKYKKMEELLNTKK